MATKKAAKQPLTQLDLLTAISEKLDNILGFLAVRGVEGDDQIVQRLEAFGMGPKAISRITGDSENAVGLRLMRLRRKAETKVAKKKAPKKGAMKADDAEPGQAESSENNDSPES